MEFVDIRNKNEFNLIDIFKFIFAFLIIGIHVPPFGQSQSTAIFHCNFFFQQCLGRLAIPFFFICSGFFLFKKFSLNDVNLHIVFKYLLRIIIIYLAWSLIYLPINFIDGAFSSDKGLFWSILVYGYNFLLKGSYGHLWYLLSLIFGILVISFLLKKKVSLKIILIISFSFYIIGLFNQNYYGFIEPLENNYLFSSFHKYFVKLVGSTRNWLFEGLPFISIGAFFAYKPLKLKQKNRIVLLTISFLLMVLEISLTSAFGLTLNYDYCLFLAPTSFFLFSTVALVPIHKENKNFVFLRKMSTLIYLTQFLFIRTITQYLGFQNLILVDYLIVCISTTILSILIIKISEIKCLSFIRRIF